VTFSKWLETNNGKYVEVAGSAAALNQCTDLANSFIRDVLSFPIIEWTNAIDFPKKAGDRYQWVKNSPTALPEAGDLMIFKLGAYGHISVFIEGNLSSFRSFDQNYPLGTPCHVQNHTYSSVAGWLHPLNVKIEDNMTSQEANILKFIKEQNADEGKVREAFGCLQDLPGKNEQILILTNKVSELEVKLLEVTKSLDDIKRDFVEKQKNEMKQQKLLETANAIIDEQKLKIDDLDRLAKDNKNLYLNKNEEFNKYKELKNETLIEELKKNLSVTSLFSLLVNKIFSR